LILVNLDRVIEELYQHLLPRVLREVALSILQAVGFDPVTCTDRFVDRHRQVEQVLAAQIRLLLQVLQEVLRHVVVYEQADGAFEADAVLQADK
jgi:triosephosphate isomerase